MNLSELMQRLMDEKLYFELLSVNDRRSKSMYYGIYEVILNRNNDGTFYLFWCNDRGMVCGSLNNVSEEDACNKVYQIIKQYTANINEYKKSSSFSPEK